MAVQRGVHPSVDVLKAFGLGKLDDSSSEVVMNHLEQCENCRNSVASLSGDDFLNRLRQAHGRSTTPAPAKPLADVVPSSQPRAGQTPIPNLPPELAANPQYEILRELGRGGMGVVYLAKNKLMDRLEVLKVVNKALLDHPGAVERFLREIRSAAKLSHANVVAAYHALQIGELLAFAMEYIEGQDLASVVKAQGPLPIPHACFYVQQAAHGLQHAFEKQMVHRDIKPQNLILAREGKKHIVKVLDFGLAKATREKNDDTGLTGEGKMLGTPDYIAPEQTMDAAHADIRADIYSLGCTLYYLLSGNPPFSASSLGAILVAHQMHEAKPLNLVRPEVPEELAAVVRRMMAKTPAKRYQTPLQVVQALAPFVKQGATPKPSRELSSGAVEAKPAVKKAAPVSPPLAPAADVPKQQPVPADVWRSLTEGGSASVAQHKSAVIRKSPAAAGRQRTAQQKWVMGGCIGASMILMLLLGMWIGGVFKAKTPDGTKEPQEDKPAKSSDPITNSIGMRFVFVKPGAFLMGSPSDENGHTDEEKQHKVEITQPFYAGVHEVTQEQYERVMEGKNPSYFSMTGGGKDKVEGIDTRRFPVESVSWEDATTFCRGLSEGPEEKSKGRAYRLPTEAEWEYCCRGGHFFKKPSPPFHFGDSLSSSQANFDGSFPFGGAPKGRFWNRTTNVGSYFSHHPLGLCDLHGNVNEWCADCYDRDYYKRSPLQNPQGPATGNFRVLRGGSWFDSGTECRAAYRSLLDLGVRNIYTGFRVVLILGARN